MFYDKEGKLNTFGGAHINGSFTKYYKDDDNSLEKDLILCFKLNDEVAISGGSGLKDDPYKLSLSE